MSFRLKSRDRFIPNGFQFVQPEIKFQAPRFQSFSRLVNAVMAARAGNPHLVAKHHWALDYDSVANEVEAYNANVCAIMGWTDYITAPVGEPPPPKYRPPTAEQQKQVSAAGAKVRKIWAGVKTLNDWIDSGVPAVPQEKAEARAAVCVACPKNGQGDFTKWFTAPAAEAIRRQQEKLSSRKLATSLDDKLGVCEACLCPLRLKAWTPFPFIKAHLSEAVLRDLETAPACWIVVELKA